MAIFRTIIDALLSRLLLLILIGMLGMLAAVLWVKGTSDTSRNQIERSWSAP